MLLFVLFLIFASIWVTELLCREQECPHVDHGAEDPDRHDIFSRRQVFIEHKMGRLVSLISLSEISCGPNLPY